ncbi:MAG: MFS transporter [Eubacteriaceae bacterium]|nr:MFS transporter [Eubacteriaceae bacterium]
MDNKKPLSNRAKNLYGISDFGFSFMANIENFFWMYYMINVAKFPMAGIALANSVAYTLDAFAQPVYAALISALKPMKWGKNRSYILLFPPLVSISFILCFSNIGPTSFALFLCGLMMFVTNGTRTMTWTSNLNMMNVLASDSNERSTLASRRATWTSAAGIIYSYAVLPNITRLQQTMDEKYVFTLLAALTSIFYAITCWISYWATAGSEATGEEAKAQGSNQMNMITLPDLVKSVFQNPPLLTILVGAIISSVFTSAVSTATTYYYIYVMDYKYYPMQLLATAIVGTFASYFSGWAGRTFGNRNAVLIGQAGTVLSNVVIGLFFAYTNPIAMIVVMCIARVFSSFSMANMQALYGDCVVYARWKTGKDTSALVMGSQTIPIKIGLTLRGVVVPIILSMVNFDASIAPADATMELKRGIVIMLRWLPAIGTTIYSIILFFGFRMLNREKVEQMQLEINEREAAAQA